MRKVKILVRTSAKVARKIVRGDLSYKDKNIIELTNALVKLLVESGPKNTLVRIKKEILSIDKTLGNNLVFPNGLITGVSKDAIKKWYKTSHHLTTIVIPSYNDFELLKPCIESIKKTVDKDKVNVVVVDDYCKPSFRKQLKTIEDEQIKVIYRKTNGGFAKAVNTGLKAVNKNRDVVLLNSDTIAHDGWLEALQYGAYEFGVDTGIVGPKLLYPDGRIQSAGSYRNTESPKWFDHYYRFQDKNYGPANIPQYCLAVTGACMYIKRGFMEHVGILDEKFSFAFEDVDLCLRGWEEGYRSLYFPAATLTHVESATRPKNKNISEKEKRSIEYFWEKWSKWFDNRNVYDSQGKLRIIFVLQSMGMSGGIRSIFEISNMLSKRDFSVEIWGLDSKNRPWDISDKVKIRTFKDYERLTAALSKEEAIKVATWWETSHPVWLASVTKGIPVYFIQEIETWFYPKDIVSQSTVLSCYRKEFNNLTESSYNQKELKEMGLLSTLIPLGFDQDTYKPLNIKRDTKTLLAVGRSFFQKNFKLTFDAWKTLGDKRPNMVLFGIEPEIAKQDARIKYITRPTNKEVNELYNKATVFVQTSKHEGYCLPILEAMATGCPVICTDAHGNRDFCVKDKNCLMVEQGDIEGLARTINDLIANKDLQAKLSKEALNTAENFKWEVVINRFEKYYKELAASKK